MSDQIVQTIKKELVGGRLRMYLDKRLVNAVKIYIDNAESKITANNCMINNAIISAAMGNKGQKAIKNILQEYGKLDSFKVNMSFVSYVVLSVIISQFRLEEINNVLGSNKDELDLGITSSYWTKVTPSIDLLYDLESDITKYCVYASKGDIRYIEVGLKRLLAAEVDSVV